MHPDLDIHGVLQAAYRNDLEAKAAKYRLLKSAKQGVSRTARRDERLLPLARLILLLVPRPQFRLREAT